MQPIPMIFLAFLFAYVCAVHESYAQTEGCTDNVILSGPVTPDWISIAQGVGLCLNRNRDSRLTVEIVSDGGDLNYGIATHDQLRRVRRGLTTHATGKVSSAATIAFLAGETRTIYCHALLHFHAPSIYVTEGARLTPDDLRALLSRLEIQRDAWAMIIANNSEGKINLDEARRILSRETFISPSEAVRLGLAHAVTDC